MALLRDDLQDYKPAGNLQFNQSILELQRNGRFIYHLGFGQSPFPVIESATRALQQHCGANEYLPSSGLLDLRREIVAFHKRHDGFDFSPDDVVVGPGSKELVFLLMTVFGGEVLILSPSWTTYKPQAQLSGRPFRVISTSRDSDWKLTPQLFEKALADCSDSTHKLLIFCNPDNPTGTGYSEDELRDLANVFRRRGILVLSDEIYARLRYDGHHSSLAQFYAEGTIVSTGFSKWASAGGWRLGYHIFPTELSVLKEAVKSAGSHSYSCAPAPMQYAVIEMLKDTAGCEDYIRHTTRILAAVSQFCQRELSSVGVITVPATAGYYIFPDFEVLRKPLAARGIGTCEQMCAALLDEAGVALMAGGPSYLRPLDEFTVRLCYVDFDGTKALAASRSIGLTQPLPQDFVRTNCSKMHEALQALTSWVKKLSAQ